MADFLSVLNELSKHIRNGKDNDCNNTDIESSICTTKIPTDKFHFILNFPSVILVLMILLLACTISRKRKWLEYLWGRPGAVFPMDILGKSSRFSYAAAWGSIAFLAVDLLFGVTFIVKLEGPSYVTVFSKVLSIIVIGVDYFQMFAALALESVTGYIVGTAYAWMLLSVQIFRGTECDLVAESRLILIARDLPNLLSLGYLSVSLPVRAVHALKNRSLRIVSSTETVSILNLENDVELSPEAIHVKRLLRPILPPPPAPSTVREKMMDAIKAFTSKWIYHKDNKFRYSARILSVMLIGLMLIYKATLQMMVLFLSVFALLERDIDQTLEAVGYVAKKGEESQVTETRDAIYALKYLLINGKICFIVAMSLACAGGILGILHSLSSYRTNLFDLYKVVTKLFNMVGSMRYAGYQVAYIGWGLVLHFIFLFIVVLALAVIITMIKEGYYQWLLDILMSVWPAILMTLVISITQTLLADFAFLQEKGAVLAIDNRRVLFSFTFFMFFYNIFIGFLSCLLRIIKSIVIGAIFLPRLDYSALPRRFQMFDSGFANYCGFIHVECAHSHPVLIMFLRVLLIGSEKKQSETVADACNTTIHMNIRDAKRKQHKKVNLRAKTRWFLMYTLTNNPSLRVQRKAYLRYMKILQERLARNYSIDKKTIGNLINYFNTAFVNKGTTDIDDVAVDVTSDERTNAAQSNLNALFGMSKLLLKIQKDMAEKKGMFSDSEIPDGQTTDTHNMDNRQASDETNVFVKTAKNIWKRTVFPLTQTGNSSSSNI